MIEPVNAEFVRGSMSQFTCVRVDEKGLECFVPGHAYSYERISEKATEFGLKIEARDRREGAA